MHWASTTCAATVWLIAGATGCTRLTPYDRLCRIYEDARGQASTPELAMDVAKRVETEIPEIARDYGFLANVDLGDRYEVLKALAKDKAHQDDWHCAEIQKWYPPKKPQ